MGISVEVKPTSLETSKIASDLVKELIQKNKKTVLGLATGSSVIRLYSQLVKSYKKGEIDFSLIHTFNLDEYYKIDPTFSLSYRYFMDNHLFNHINIPKENINFLNGISKNPTIECENYEKKIKTLKGIDCQILGIGVNGHIAFCEPYADFNSTTSLVKLSEETINQNSDGRFFRNESEVPKYALTMGIKTIMEAKKIILLANGPRKALAVKQAIEGPVTNSVPASILQKHNDVKWLLDEEAASEI